MKKNKKENQKTDVSGNIYRKTEILKDSWRKTATLGIGVSILILFSWINTAADTATGNQSKSLPQFDIGGVSIDLSERSPEKTEITGEDLIDNGSFEEIEDKTGKPKGWTDEFHVHTHDKEQGKSLTPKLAPIMERTLSCDNPPDGKNCVLITSPLKAYEAIQDEKQIPLISNYYATTVELSDTSIPRKFLLSFKYRGKSFLDANDRIMVLVEFRDGAEKTAQRKTTRDMIMEGLPFSATWKERQLEFVAPQGTKYLTVYLRLYNYGEAAFDEVKLHELNVSKGVTIRLLPFSFLDNLFCISSGNPGILTLSCQNEADVKINKPFVYLELPEKIELLQPRLPLKLQEKGEVVSAGEKYIRYKIDISGLKHTIPKYSYNIYHAFACLLYTDLPAGGVYSGKYWFQDENYETPPRNFALKVLPGIKGKTPLLFESGAMFSRNAEFDDDRAVETLTSFYRNVGFNAVHLDGKMMKILESFRNKNIKRYMQPQWLCNGYRIGLGTKPDNVKFQAMDGSYCKDSGRDGLCPVEVYTEGEYFNEYVVKPLREILVVERSFDGIMPNWEPFMFDYKGCFCPKCKQEFIKYSGLPEDEVNNLWPKDIIKEYRDLWVKFRSWQHGKMVVTIEKIINGLGKEAGIDAHFIPEIAWCSLSERYQNLYTQNLPVDYLDKLPVLEPWGPYVLSSFQKPYKYGTGSHLATYGAASEVNDFIAKRIKDPEKRPKLISFPHGYQKEHEVTEPEAIAFEYLCFFLNRWHGAMAYYFPKGYDARYWAALANANTLIADYESFVFKGIKSPDVTVKTETPVPPFGTSTDGVISCVYDVSRIPLIKENPSLIQMVAYELDGKRMIAVGNFWQKGDVFVRLSVSGLQENQQYVLRQPQFDSCLTGKNGNKALSAAELRNGILIHVGALRFSFFVVETYKDGMNYGMEVTPAIMNDFMAKRLPEIKESIAFEDKYRMELSQKEVKENEIPDYAKEIKNLSQGKLSCKAETPMGTNALCAVISNGDEKLIIDPANGGRIKSWENKTTELISQSPTMGMALDAFWWPMSAIITAPYNIDRVEIKDGVLTLSMHRTLTVKDNMKLAGMTVTKTYNIFEKDGSVKVSSEIKNTTEGELSFSFRHHNMLSFMEIRNGKSGYAVIGGGNSRQKFERTFTTRLYRFFKDPDQELEKAFNIDGIKQIADSTAEFESPWTPSILAIDILNKKDLHGFIFWDSADQDTASFEPLYKVIKLAPGMSWSADMFVRLKK